MVLKYDDDGVEAIVSLDVVLGNALVKSDSSSTTSPNIARLLADSVASRWRGGHDCECYSDGCDRDLKRGIGAFFCDFCNVSYCNSVSCLPAGDNLLSEEQLAGRNLTCCSSCLAEYRRIWHQGGHRVVSTKRQDLAEKRAGAMSSAKSVPKKEKLTSTRSLSSAPSSKRSLTSTSRDDAKSKRTRESNRLTHVGDQIRLNDREEGLLRRLGRRQHASRGDGHCGFESAAVQLSLAKTELRSVVASVMESPQFSPILQAYLGGFGPRSASRENAKQVRARAQEHRKAPEANAVQFSTGIIWIQRHLLWRRIPMFLW